jgi:leader peptidase (prepilin peptidase) / N-methyltransferase
MIAGPAVIALAAPFIGSFLGVIVTRHAQPLSIAAPRSRCDACAHPLAPSDMVPIASWLARRGRCRYCDAAIGWFYPAIEVAAFGVALWAAIVASGWEFGATCLLGWMLLALAIIDWRDFVLPDFLTLPLLAAGLIVTWVLDPAELPANLIGAVAGLAFVLLVRIAYQRLRDREGIGLGDAKLLAAAGAWVGWSGLPMAVLIASLAGIAACLLRLARGDRVSATDRVPFGAFLCLGTWLAWLYG